MDFSNFGKIKKIFYIVAIISMLLSIKSRVFGATPITMFNEPVAQVDPIQVTDNLSLTPVNFLLSSDYDMYTILVKTLPNDVAYDGYAIIVHKGDTLKIQYSDKKNGLNRAYPTLVFSAPNKTCTIPFNVRLDSNLQNVYDNRMNSYSSSNLWWNTSDEYSFSAWSFSQFSESFPNNISYSSNSYIDFYNTSNEKIDEYAPFVAPFFDNASEIENGNPDGVYISAGDISQNDNLYFHLLQIDTGLSSSDQSIYYYSDKTILLNKDSDYYRTWNDPSIEGFYYYIPRYKLGLSQNTSYLYVLNNSKQQIQNSFGIYEKDITNGIYDVVQSDTAGVITATEEESDRMKNIEQMLVNNQDSINNINDTLTNTTASEETETDVESSLNYSNENPTISNLRGGFFTRLSAMLANLTNYNLRQDTAVSVPLPHSDKNLTFHSIDIYNNVPDPLKTIINLFWVFIFNFYLFKFVNHLYISITTGKILEDFNAKNEVITDQML